MISMELIALVMMTALILIALGLYWLPSIIGYYRHSPDIFTVVVTNALLGWTIVGWLVALFMVTRSAGPRSASGSRADDPGTVPPRASRCR
jgi:hypothetical protein